MRPDLWLTGSIISIWVVQSDNCAATTGTTTSATATTTTTTTASSVTTTTTVATTTTSSCSGCTSDQITFVQTQADDPTSIDSTFRIETLDPATGCLTLTAICDANDGFFSFMQFNINEGGPAENADMTEITEAALDCINGVWVYRMERTVTTVECFESPVA